MGSYFRSRLRWVGLTFALYGVAWWDPSRTFLPALLISVGTYLYVIHPQGKDDDDASPS